MAPRRAAHPGATRSSRRPGHVRLSFLCILYYVSLPSHAHVMVASCQRCLLCAPLPPIFTCTDDVLTLQHHWHMRRRTQAALDMWQEMGSKPARLHSAAGQAAQAGPCTATHTAAAGVCGEGRCCQGCRGGGKVIGVGRFADVCCSAEESVVGCMHAPAQTNARDSLCSPQNAE